LLLEQWRCSRAGPSAGSFLLPSESHGKSSLWLSSVAALTGAAAVDGSDFEADLCDGWWEPRQRGEGDDCEEAGNHKHEVCARFAAKGGTQSTPIMRKSKESFLFSLTTGGCGSVQW
jgi:hypothetical protein